MQKKLTRNLLWSFALMVFLLCCADQKAFAQMDDPSLVWKAKTPVTRVEKPYHKPKAKPKVKPKAKPKPVIVQAPLLSLRWSLKMQDSNGLPKAVHPDHVFKIGERVQLVAEVNQSGYLYIVQEDDLSMIFPYQKINGGKNYVLKEQPIVIPSNCAKSDSDTNGNCWFRVNNSGSALTVIFSREQINGLPTEIDEDREVVPITREDLKKLQGRKEQDLRQKDIKGTDVVQYWNNNPKDNEILIIDTKIAYEKSQQ